MNSTLGTRYVSVPACSLSNYPPISVHPVARAAMASMSAAQPNAESLSDIYSKGVEATMPMYHALQSIDMVYNWLTDGQEGALL